MSVKSINDVAFCYIEYYPLEQKSDHFELSAQIMPSPEESAARVKRDEAILYEKGPEGDMRESPTGFLTGKGAFSTVSLIERTALCVKIYDELKAATAPLDEAKTEKLKAAEAFLMKYHIPKNPDDRKPLSDYIKPSTIESISKASAFSNEGDETFNFQEARIAANLCAGLLGQDHHNSFIELVEPYNRLLSVVGIRALDNPEDQETARMAQSSQFPVVKINEHMMPHFFDQSYKDSLVERAEGLKEKVEEIRAINKYKEIVMSH